MLYKYVLSVIQNLYICKLLNITFHPKAFKTSFNLNYFFNIKYDFFTTKYKYYIFQKTKYEYYLVFITTLSVRSV